MTDPHGAPAGWRRLAPAVTLLFLAPWAAECSWGGFAVTDMLFVIVVLAPMYGGAALLIREAARRTGGGWPMIVLLAAAFGVAQAGLVDQSLFNPDFLADTEFADLQAADRTRVPVLGISAQEALSYLGNHVALTICAPIAVVESYLSPARRQRPWLRTPGLVGTVALYLAGSLLIFSDDSGRKGFVAAPGQLVGAAVVVLALVAAAALPRWRRRPPRAGARPAPRARWVVTAVLIAYVGVNLVSGWPAVAGWVAVAALLVTVLARWSGRTGWRQRHVLAGAGGALLGASTLAYLIPPYAAASRTEALVSDVAVSVVALALLTGASARLHRRPPSSRAGTPAPAECGR
ncbi:hypothetical protein [Micromonospora endolithica]|uniref:Uncharacterized protein n=1 Tax=Micromonospora endolithica TaxID=230091 RepID=A0A3A9ZJB7_9ACTN|nr:hypothetical protein [Micromonospora endolithica]RKN48472.1 hypothetical protein D7223_10795 [Micromonospora endolithica]TWJ24444.1 hypothetical protein JD76_04594 [Micromonospora endolithica]